MGDDFAEEAEVLRSIYDAQIRVTLRDSGDEQGEVVYTDERGVFSVYFTVPKNYPQASPTVKISTTKQNEDIKTLALEAAADIMGESMGNVAIFSVIEGVKELFCDAEGDNEDEGTNEDAGRDGIDGDEGFAEPVEAIPVGPSVDVTHGPTTTEQKSSFQSHFAFVHSMSEVKAFKDAVYEDKKVARATHNIFAYRFTCRKTGIVYHDCDDDGETAAGSRLAEMIRLMKVDNVAVIVSRWFGGILLGPDRFKLICNSARDLLEAHAFVRPNPQIDSVELEEAVAPSKKLHHGKKR